LIEIVRGIQQELLVVARPAETGRTIRLGFARTVKILDPAIQLPPLDRIYLTRAGTGEMAHRVDHIARTDKYGQTMRIPPSVKTSTFDLWWSPQRGQAVRMIKNLTLDESSVSIKPEEHLGLVRVTGTNLPATSLLLLTPVGTPSFATRAEAAQSAPRYGVDMVIAPGQYDLWSEPADGSKSERLAEKLEVTAGKVTVIE
jgi:hypothetical protein